MIETVKAFWDEMWDILTTFMSFRMLSQPH